MRNNHKHKAVTGVQWFTSPAIWDSEHPYYVVWCECGAWMVAGNHPRKFLLTVWRSDVYF